MQVVHNGAHEVWMHQLVATCPFCRPVALERLVPLCALARRTSWPGHDMVDCP